MESSNSNPKISPGGKIENGFQTQRETVESDRNRFQPGTIPPIRKKRVDSFKKKELSGLDKYLIFSFTSIIIFTIAVLVIYVFTRDEPAVLVGCFFGAFSGEILMCALIKRLKLHKEAELNKKDTDVPY